jgi:hypothetical protein
VQFCIDALEEAMARHGPPEIFNTDQGNQFTSWPWWTCPSQNQITAKWNSDA